MNGWSLRYEEFDPAQEALREALCTLGNGYFATRGAAPEASADDVHYPGTYLAGGYNRLRTDLAGRTVENEDLVNFPNWLPLSFRFQGGEWFDLRRVELLAYGQELDIRRGVLQRQLRFRDQQGRVVALRQRRLVHQANPHLAALETTLTAENWSGPLEVRSALDGRVVNDGVRRYRSLANRHLQPLEAVEAEGGILLLRMRTCQSRLEMVQAARTRIFQGAREVVALPQQQCEPGYAAQLFLLELAQGEELRLEKVVALFTSRDRAMAEAGLEARQAAAAAPGFGDLLASHTLAWQQLWRRFSIDLEADGKAEVGEALTILRLHIFHLLQTVSMHSIDLDVGVPSRGWHGEAYRGHVFWDELYIFPLLNLRVPEITRTLLTYRARRLGQARANARAAGFRGAMYPWQSGSNGREESQVLHLNPESGRWLPDRTHLQRHVNAAIAYNIWQYFQVTHDREFLYFHGAEMILEIARFWASLATWSEAEQRFEIRGVMGPDEYHDALPGSEEGGLANNAYTNVMAVWVLRTALEVLAILPRDRRRDLCETLALQPEETALWEKISRRMRLCFHADGIISQFEGYGDLEEFDWETYRQKHGPVMRLDRILEAEGDTPNRYQVSKQADVLMLFYLFSAEELQELFERLDYPFEYRTIPRNIEYYLQRTSHGSTLSQIVHAWVLARADRDQAWELFCTALNSDISDIQGGTTPEGIHLGAMAGTVDLVQRCFTGLEIRGDLLRFNPCLPRDLSRLELHIRYRGQSLVVTVTRERFTIHCLQCGAKPIRIGFRDQSCDLHGGETREFICRSETAGS
ncbi:MAG: glycoside hydrolase family 65 protein [Desulfuromonadales bacterium]|nr:glycoside hydrolase family 65 protein [Desulfuromonadales bacterium]